MELFKYQTTIENTNNKIKYVTLKSSKEIRKPVNMFKNMFNRQAKQNEKCNLTR